MLLAHTRLIHTPVMSLQTGAELARTVKLIIDPRNLTVVAYELDGPALDEHPSYIRPTDIRELSAIGFIVDSSDEFIAEDDVILIKQVIDFGFQLEGIDVVDDMSKKLGKVHAYTLDSDGYAVQQLNVKRPFLRSFNETELIVGRSQVLEVNNSRILVKSTREKASKTENIREYANPFKNRSAQPEAFDNWK